MEESTNVQLAQCIWSFHLVGCSNLRQTCGDLYEQFRIQKATADTSEVQIFYQKVSRHNKRLTGGKMFSMFRKKFTPPTYAGLPVMTANDLGIFPKNIRTDAIGHDFCFDWQGVQVAAKRQQCNLDDYLCVPLVKRILAVALKNHITFWYTPLGKQFIVTAYSPSEVDFFNPLYNMHGYVDYGGNYLRSTARPFLHWDGNNVFRVQAISTPPNGLFFLADFGNGFGLDVSDTDEDTYKEIQNNSNKHFEYSAIPNQQIPNTSNDANLVKNVFCVSLWG